MIAQSVEMRCVPPRHTRLRRAAVFGLVLAIGVPLASAHPLGDNSVTHISVLHLYRDRIEVELFIDIAEIPCMGALLEMDTNQDGEPSRREQRIWLTEAVERHRSHLKLSLNGREVALRVADDIPAPDGSKSPPYVMLKDVGNLPGLWTLKILARYVAIRPPELAAGPVRLTYEDATYPKVTGMKRVLLERSAEVRVDQRSVKYLDEGDPFAYEQYDPFNMPQERTATVTFTNLATASTTSAPVAVAGTGVRAPTSTSAPASAPAGPTIAGRALEDVPAAPGRTARARKTADRILARIGGDLNATVLAAITFLCFVYGAWHALLPGHAKTVVAAYLISQHGRARHAVALALTVTATHTFIVYVMMAVIFELGAAQGSRLQLWLGALSGAIILCMGMWLGFRAVTGRLAHHDHHDHHHHHDANAPWWKKLFTHSHPEMPGHDHHHDHAHAHAHAHDHAHTHDHHHHTHDHDHHTHATPQASGEQQITTRQILALGIGGGIVPCPAATFLGLGLIGAYPFLAFFLVTVFSVGLALTLMAVGLAALVSNRFAGRVMRDAEDSGAPNRWMTRILPAASSLAVMTVGGLMVAHYAYWLTTGQGLIGWLG